MNNIEKFEDFLDKMQGLIDNAKKQGHIIVPIEDIEATFPELKESEDEQHRKWILEYLYDGLRKSDEQFKDQFKCSIDWLEKQGNQTIFNTPSRETILAIWELGNDWKELTKGVISTEHGTQLDYIQKHWSESEHYLRERRKHKHSSNEQQGKSALEAAKEEKVDNANKVEPKPKSCMYLRYTPKERKKMCKDCNEDCKYNPTGQVDIDIPFGANDSELQEASYHIPEGFYTEIQGDKVVIKKGEKKSNRSEEEEKLIDDIISALSYCTGIGCQNSEHYDILIDKLQSIKQKMIK